MNGKEFDVAVIGAGPGGYIAAIRAAQLGLSVGIVERSDMYGGTCLNVGCIPSKALLDSTELYSRMRNEASEHGIQVASPKIDCQVLHERKNNLIARMGANIGVLLKKNNIERLTGTASFHDAHTLRIRNNTGEISSTITARNIIIATGSKPIQLSIAPFNGKTVVSSTEALNFSKPPNRLIIVGGGAIGLEIGSVWSRVGSQVTIVEALPEILRGWDKKISAHMRKLLTAQGMEFRIGMQVMNIDDKNANTGESSAVKVGLALAGTSKIEETLEGDVVLVAVGRRPFTETLNLEAVGITPDVHTGRIKTDEKCATAVPHIYAIGDVTYGPMLAHKAEDEGIAAAEIIAGGVGEVNHRTIPNVVYTAPELASVGRTEEELRAEGVEYAASQFPFAANGRAQAMNQRDGFVRILADRKSDAILGAQIIGPCADILIAEIVTVMEYGGCAEDIARTPHAHPTLSEAVRESALGIAKRAIHIF